MHTPVSVLRRLAGVLALVSTVTSLQAAAPEPDLHAELRLIKDKYESAVNTGDFSQLAGLFAPDTSAVNVDGKPFRTIDDLKATLEAYRSAFPGIAFHVVLAPEPSQIYGDIAVAHGTIQQEVTTGSSHYTLPGTWTAVLRRANGTWKLIRAQGTIDPFANSIVEAQLDHTRWVYGGIALFAGLVMGLGLGRVRGNTQRS